MSSTNFLPILHLIHSSLLNPSVGKVLPIKIFSTVEINFLVTSFRLAGHLPVCFTLPVDTFLSRNKIICKPLPMVTLKAFMGKASVKYIQH